MPITLAHDPAADPVKQHTELSSINPLIAKPHTAAINKITADINQDSVTGQLREHEVQPRTIGEVRTLSL